MTNRVELRIAERFVFADGHEFGTAGAYERLTGPAHFRVDPHAPAQRAVTDIDKAKTDSDGFVAFTADRGAPRCDVKLPLSRAAQP